MAEPALPNKIPIITLAQCNLLPHGLLPLYIFEPRYRQMLEDALKHDRFFCVATRIQGSEVADDDDAVFQASTAGLIRACVKQDDGTSHVVLQGVQRIRFLEYLQREPYRVARIEPIVSVDGEASGSAALCDQLLSALPAGVDESFVERLKEMKSPEMVADVVGFNLIQDAYERQPLVGMENVQERLQYLLKVFASVA